MTCVDARDLFSARVDDALAPGERAQLDAHLATCSDCAREWQRFQATIGLLHLVEPARAPAGFVDRVLAARPRPWYRRLAHQLFVPWPVKLPVEAAAVVLTAGLAVLVFQRSPELQQAARGPEAPVSARAPEPPAPATVAEQAAPAPSLPSATKTGVATSTPGTPPPPVATGAPAPPATAAALAPPATAPPREAPARAERGFDEALALRRAPAPSVADSRADEAARPQAKRDRSTPEAFAPPPAASQPAQGLYGGLRAGEAQPPVAGRQEGRDVEQGSAPHVTAPPAGQRAAKVERLTSSLEARAAIADVEARLAAPDRAAVEREVRTLVARLGGVVTAPRPEALEIVVPRTAWDELTRELGRLGTLRIDRASADPPPAIRLTLRLVD